ncbi:MAG TPA: hypothetical protein VGG89_00230 [Candidatus Baltobacteraceae bacterium]
MKRYSILAMLVSGIAVFLSSLPASAVTTVSRTVPAGTKLHCVLADNIDSRTLIAGTGFLLRVDDPSQGALDEAWIKGHVTDVAQPQGLDRARIGFVLSNIRLRNGERAGIHAEVLGENITQIDMAAVKREREKFLLPAMPRGTVTPGPIAFQITFREGSKPSVTPPPSVANGGYIYAAKSNENIVMPAGTPVTIKLTSNLVLQ